MAVRYEYPTVDEMMVRLLEHYEASSNEGERWYRESRRFARQLCADHGISMGKAAGIIAALSPQVQWKVNKRLAAQVAAQGTPTEGCMGQSAHKAWRIWMGERPLKVLGGPKTRAFYRAIMGDKDAAVIDTWMLKAVQWPTESVSPKKYVEVAEALRCAASHTSHSVADFQAIVWTQVRGGAE